MNGARADPWLEESQAAERETSADLAEANARLRQTESWLREWNEHTRRAMKRATAGTTFNSAHLDPRPPLPGAVFQAAPHSSLSLYFICLKPPTITTTVCTACINHVYTHTHTHTSVLTR